MNTVLQKLEHIFAFFFQSKFKNLPESQNKQNPLTVNIKFKHQTHKQYKTIPQILTITKKE